MIRNFHKLCFPAFFNQRVFQDIISPNGSFNNLFEVKLKQESECNFNVARRKTDIINTRI